MVVTMWRADRSCCGTSAEARTLVEGHASIRQIAEHAATPIPATIIAVDPERFELATRFAILPMFYRMLSASLMNKRWICAQEVTSRALPRGLTHCATTKESTSSEPAR